MLVKGPLDGVKQQKLLFRGAVSAGVFLMNHQHPYVRRFILHKWTVYKHTSNSYTWYIYIYMTGKRENELHPSKKTTHPITIYIHNSCFYQSVTTYNRWHTLHSYYMSQFFYISIQIERAFRLILMRILTKRSSQKFAQVTVAVLLWRAKS